MPADLSSYLAKHYLSADPKPSKKRKRNKDAAAASAGLLITDDSETGWTRSAHAGDDDDENNVPTTVAGTSAEFRRAKSSGWKVVGAPAPKDADVAMAGGPDDDAAAILASAAAESAAASGEQRDDDPAVVMMSDGTHAGLQSAATVSAQLARRKALEEAEFEKMRKHEREAETVYRDATGRRIDVSMKRAEARRQLAEAEQKKAEAVEALRGEVQVQQAQQRRELLRDAKLMTVARGADDEEMNRELKEKTRWGDTMADMIGTGAGPAAGGSKKKNKGRPVYQGAAPPNRYGIRPGYRWDGVDRGNGWEAERFRAMNRVERNKNLEYNWQMDE